MTGHERVWSRGARGGAGAVVDQGKDALQTPQLQVLPILRDEFDRAIGQLRPTVGPRELESYERWRLTTSA